MKRVLETSLAIVFFAATTAWADLKESRSPSAELMARICPYEWNTLERLSPSDAHVFESHYFISSWTEAIAGADGETQNVLYKPLLFAAFGNEVVQTILELENPERHNRDYLTRASAQFALHLCLLPTSEEKQTILAFHTANPSDIEPSQWQHIFATAERFDCTNFVRAFELYIAINPEFKNRHRDFIRIVRRTTQVCEETMS